MAKLATLGAAALVLFSSLAEAATPLNRLMKSFEKRDVDPSLLYPAYNISVPIDHFHNESQYEPHSNGSFNLRYFFDASHYKTGGPVIVLHSGEDTAVDRLPYLQKGIIQQLAQATNGIAVVLEHRYYGTSWPVDNLTLPNWRFLTTDQAMADASYFAQNVVFPGLESCNLTSDKTPYIAYGGSYAGAFAAYLRTLYPDVWFGSIASSGVVEAITDYWQYYQPIIDYGPPKCIKNTQKLINVVDNILIGKNQSSLTTQLKTAFGLQSLQYDGDFANVLTEWVGDWQGLNWDPAVNEGQGFYQYCGNVTSSSVLYPATANISVESLIEAGGWGNETKHLATAMRNLIGYTNLTSIEPCLANGQTIDQCFNTHAPEQYQPTDLVNGAFKSWPYQFCTQWGFFQTGSGFPPSELPLVSRTQDLEWFEVICVEAFNITTPPNTQAINQYGGWATAYSRLAFIDGKRDPWRPACAHSQYSPYANRTSTTDQPYILISDGVHHWDENGLFANQTTSTLPPAPVANTQKDEAQFVQAWLKEWPSEQARRLKAKRTVGLPFDS